jgi:hypothetical protein
MKSWQKIVCYANGVASAGLLRNINVIGVTYCVFRAVKIAQTSSFTALKSAYLGMARSVKMTNLCSTAHFFYLAPVFVNTRTVATLHTSAKKGESWQTSH